MEGELSILATPLTCTLLLRYIDQVDMIYIHEWDTSFLMLFLFIYLLKEKTNRSLLFRNGNIQV